MELSSSSMRPLDPALAQQARDLGKLIRNGQVVPLVGAGISMPSRMPSWETLIRALVNAWQSLERQRGEDTAQHLSPEQYLTAMCQTFGTDLAIASYLQGQMQDGPRRGGGTQKYTLADLLYAALYTHPDNSTSFTPGHNDLHRQIMALFGERAPGVWTTNYDDLLECAAHEAHILYRSLDPVERTESRNLSIVHLHGYLTPPDRKRNRPSATKCPVILTEDDYHRVAADVSGWTNREFYRLFEGHSVLILGMSLSDPDLRRALTVIASQRNLTRATKPPQHFAIMGDPAIEDAQAPPRHMAYWNRCRASFWTQHGVHLIELPEYGSTSPFLLRLRYESWGDKRGALWAAGLRTFQAARVWDTTLQEFASRYLADAAGVVRRKFGISADDLEIGIFLLRNRTTLELTFRGGRDQQARQGAILFSVDPDGPEGVAGHVFVSGAVNAVRRDDPLYLHSSGGNDPQPRTGQLVSCPIVHWSERGIPVGVVYISSRQQQAFFRDHNGEQVSEMSLPLSDLYIELEKVARDWLSLIHSK